MVDSYTSKFDKIDVGGRWQELLIIFTSMQASQSVVEMTNVLDSMFD